MKNPSHHGGSKISAAGALSSGLVVLGTFLLFFSCSTSPVQRELAETYYKLGNAYLDLERWNEAETAYARALDLDPEMYRAGYNMARIYIYNGNHEYAVNILNELLEEDPGNIMIRESLAWAYLKMGRQAEAEQLYRGILHEDPANCDVRYNLSLLLKEEEKWEEIYSLLFECVELEEADGEILFLLGRAERNTGRGRGIGWMEEAVKIDRKNPDLLAALAEIYREEKMYTEAVKIYDDLAASRKEKRGEYLFEKASLLYTAMDEAEEAFQALRRAVDEGYGNTEALATLMSEMGYEKNEDLPEELSRLFREAGLLTQLTSELQKLRLSKEKDLSEGRDSESSNSWSDAP
jgi:tetratricopeptide (TPR) repeat protein